MPDSHTDSHTTSLRRLAFFALAAIAIVAAPGAAHADRYHGRGGPRHDWHRGGGYYTGGYYAPPPVVYQEPVYAPPPVVYGGGPGIGLNFNIR